MNKVRAYAPATVANLACGFDSLGLAIDSPGDIIEVCKNDTGELKVLSQLNNINLPLAVDQNVCSVAIESFRKAFNPTQGYTITMVDKINPGSGIGSSAASAVAAVYAVNKLEGEPFTKLQLMPFALDGEAVASGAIHADNIAACMFGGIILIRENQPLDIVHLPVPNSLYCTVFYPNLKINTKESRAALSKTVDLSKAVQNSANLASFVHALHTSDYELIKRSVKDVLVEPQRKQFIKGFDQVKNDALKNNALAFSISGSGPSVFALSNSKETASALVNVMRVSFLKVNIEGKGYFSSINQKGAVII
ncbi:MAG: homoserine kinase [Sphingobacteriales bacterium]|jgi:homoserine kinase